MPEIKTCENVVPVSAVPDNVPSKRQAVIPKKQEKIAGIPYKLDSETMRQAVIMAEIIGKPKAKRRREGR